MTVPGPPGRLLALFYQRPLAHSCNLDGRKDVGVRRLYRFRTKTPRKVPTLCRAHRMPNFSYGPRSRQKPLFRISEKKCQMGQLRNRTARGRLVDTFEIGVGQLGSGLYRSTDTLVTPPMPKKCPAGDRRPPPGGHHGLVVSSRFSRHVKHRDESKVSVPKLVRRGADGLPTWRTHRSRHMPGRQPGGSSQATRPGLRPAPPTPGMATALGGLRCNRHRWHGISEKPRFMSQEEMVFSASQGGPKVRPRIGAWTCRKWYCWGEDHRSKAGPRHGTAYHAFWRTVSQISVSL